MQRINMDAPGSARQGKDPQAALLAELHELKHDLEYFHRIHTLFVALPPKTSSAITSVKAPPTTKT